MKRTYSSRDQWVCSLIGIKSDLMIALMEYFRQMRFTPSVYLSCQITMEQENYAIYVNWMSNDCHWVSEAIDPESIDFVELSIALGSEIINAAMRSKYK